MQLHPSRVVRLTGYRLSCNSDFKHLAEMGGVKRGELPLGRRYWRRYSISRRRPHGAWSVLGLALNSTDSKIQSTVEKLVLAEEKRRPANQQERGAISKRIAEIRGAGSLLLQSRAAYNVAFGLTSSTPRVRQHRRLLSKRERKVVSAIDTARRRVAARVGPDSPGNGIVARRGVTVRSKVVPVNSVWVVRKRRRKESRRDRRKKGYVAQSKRGVLMPD